MDKKLTNKLTPPSSLLTLGLTITSLTLYLSIINNNTGLTYLNTASITFIILTKLGMDNVLREIPDKLNLVNKNYYPNITLSPGVLTKIHEAALDISILGHYMYTDNTITLVKARNAKQATEVLMHEELHWILHKEINYSTGSKLDNLNDKKHLLINASNELSLTRPSSNAKTTTNSSKSSTLEKKHGTELRCLT